MKGKKGIRRAGSSDWYFVDEVSDEPPPSNWQVRRNQLC
jgi:hypothetical protein